MSPQLLSSRGLIVDRCAISRTEPGQAPGSKASGLGTRRRRCLPWPLAACGSSGTPGIRLIGFDRVVRRLSDDTTGLVERDAHDHQGPRLRHRTCDRQGRPGLHPDLRSHERQQVHRRLRQGLAAADRHRQAPPARDGVDASMLSTFKLTDGTSRCSTTAMRCTRTRRSAQRRSAGTAANGGIWYLVVAHRQADHQDQRLGVLRRWRRSTSSRRRTSSRRAAR